MDLWLRTYAWTLFHEMLGVILSVLVGIGAILFTQMLLERQPSVVLFLGLIASLIALSVWWRSASQYVCEPDPLLDDPRPLAARVAADLTTALVGVGIIGLSIFEITTMGESQVRWALLATTLGGPFIAMGLGATWERWNRRTFG